MIYLLVIFTILCTSSLKLTADSHTDTLHNYLWANYHLFDQQKEKASAWFDTLIAQHPSVYTYKGYIYFLFNSGNYQQVVEIFKQAHQQIQTDKDMQKIYAHSLLQLGHVTQADAYYLTLYKKYPDDTEIAFYSASAYARQQELQNALDVITAFLAKKGEHPSTFAFHFLHAQIMLKLNNSEQATLSVQKAVQLNPSFDKGWLLFSLLEEQKGNIAQAIVGYSAYLQLTETPQQSIQQHLLQLVLKQKMVEQKTSPLVMSKNCFEKALILFNNNQYTAALAQINECLQFNPDNVEQNLVKIEILVSLGKVAQAVAIARQFIEKNPHEQMWYKVLYVLAEFAQPLVMDTFKDLTTRHKDYLWAPLYLVDLLLKTKEWSQAQKQIAWLQTKIDIAELQTSLAYYQALAYYGQKEFDMMATTLTTLLAKDPNYIPALNLLAYYYTTKGKKYDAATTLITQARILDPNNPALMDTHGVLLYKQKKYTEAGQLLAQAQVHDAHNSTILLHRAKVALRIQDVTTAYHLAQKAHEYTKDPDEHATLKKILAQSSPRPT